LGADGTNPAFGVGVSATALTGIPTIRGTSRPCPRWRVPGRPGREDQPTAPPGQRDVHARRVPPSDQRRRTRRRGRPSRRSGPSAWRPGAQRRHRHPLDLHPAEGVPPRALPPAPTLGAPPPAGAAVVPPRRPSPVRGSAISAAISDFRFAIKDGAYPGGKGNLV